MIQLSRDVQQNIPVFPGIRQRWEGATNALDSTVAVHEGPVLFHISCGGQCPVRRGGGGIFVGPREDEETKLARKLLNFLLPEQLREVVPEHPQRLDLS